MVYTAVTPLTPRYTQSSVNVNQVFVTSAVGQQLMSLTSQKKQPHQQHQQPSQHPDHQQQHQQTNYRIQNQTKPLTDQHRSRQRQPSSQQFDTITDLHRQRPQVVGEYDYDSAEEESITVNEGDAIHEIPRRHYAESDEDDVDSSDKDSQPRIGTAVVDVIATEVTSSTASAMGINNWPAPRRLSVGQSHTNYADPMSWSPAGTTTAAAVARRRTRDDLAEVWCLKKVDMIRMKI